MNSSLLSHDELLTSVSTIRRLVLFRGPCYIGSPLADLAASAHDSVDGSERITTHFKGEFARGSFLARNPDGFLDSAPE